MGHRRETKPAGVLGIADLLDTIKVQHVSGGMSIIGLKTYFSGREKFQGETVGLDLALHRGTNPNQYRRRACMDDVHALARNERCCPSVSAGKIIVIGMTIEEALHYTTEERQKIIDSYPPDERECRSKGIPVLGSGRIFPIAEIKIACEHRDFPSHWPRIGGMDFGWDHPFAAVELNWDRDTDTVYVARCHRLKEATPIEHAAAIRSWGRDLRWSWPREGKREALEGAGIALAEQYRDQGLYMLPEHAQFEDGSVSVEAGLMMMLDRMRKGKLRVFKEHLDWWEEFRLYHRKNGKVVKEGDDLVCATRYALMSLRYATTKSFNERWRRPIEYSNLGIV